MFLIFCFLQNEKILCIFNFILFQNMRKRIRTILRPFSENLGPGLNLCSLLILFLVPIYVSYILLFQNENIIFDFILFQNMRKRIRTIFKHFSENLGPGHEFV